MAGRYLKPGFFVSRIMNPLLMKIGAYPTLAVRGRKTGGWRSVPVNVLELNGQRYLVAPRGDTQWVRNIRTAGGGELRTKKGSETFRAVEIANDEKRPIVDAYLQRWRSTVKSQFKQLPDPADHPVFRIET